ncbi:MAG: nitroreductase family protein [Candidatus Marinimicrobia bacterium]|nr:nitroreductase family protein [Candidatus Neomarinimicrobiota bacterium]
MAESRQQSIIEIIRARRSVRTYRPDRIADNLRQYLLNAMQELQAGPFGHHARFRLLDRRDFSDQRKVFGTYGFIQNAPCFIVGTITNTTGAFEDYGYLLERLILMAQKLGLGSCWLGGSFKRNRYAKLLDLKENEVIPAVTPVGYPAEKPALRDKLIRLGAGSKNRKPRQELFFENTFHQPLNDEAAGKYSTALEMVRLAPSASNRQPWRVVKINNRYHFYLQRTPGYGRLLPEIDLQKVDIGIALCHFELSAGELALKGHWQCTDPEIPLPENCEYILSWIVD